MDNNVGLLIGVGRGRRGPPTTSKLCQQRGVPPVRTFCPTSEQIEEQMREEIEAMMEEECKVESELDLIADQSASCGDDSKVSRSVEVTGRELAGAAVLERFQGVRKFKICRSLSPDEFYLTQEEDVWFGYSKDCLVYKEFQMEMSKNEQELFDKRINVSATSGLCYAYKEQLTKEWHRVRLLRLISVKAGKNVGLVYFVDLDLYQFVPILALRHLPEKFAIRLIPIIKCFLHNAVPKEVAVSGLHYWADNALQYFHGLVRNMGNTVHARVSHWRVEQPTSVRLDAEYCVGVNLFVSSDEQEMIPVGAKLIEKGFAAPSN